METDSHLKTKNPNSPAAANAPPARNRASSASPPYRSSPPKSNSSNTYINSTPSNAIAQVFERNRYEQQMQEPPMQTANASAATGKEISVDAGGQSRFKTSSGFDVEEYPGRAVVQPVKQALLEKKARACESCRSLKVRCEPVDSNPSGPCKRCTKAGRECIFTMPSRKRVKKGDTKMAEMEKQLRLLSEKMSEMEAKRRGKERGDLGSSYARGKSEEEEDDDDEADDDDDHLMENDAQDGISISRSIESSDREKGRVHDDIYHSRCEGDQPPAKKLKTGDEPDREAKATQGSLGAICGSRTLTASHFNSDDERTAQVFEYVDVVQRQLLTMDMASAIFEHYVKDMAPAFPAVVFPNDYTAADLRKDKPLLFLAILSIASGISHPTLQKELVKELLEAFADKVIRNAEKSLELVQSLLVATVWYYPPDHLEQVNYYQLMHMAAVMALEIGMSRRSGHVRSRACNSTFIETFRKPEGAMIGCGAGGVGLCGPPSASPCEKLGASGIFKGSEGWRKKPTFPDSSSMESRRALLGCYWACSSTSISSRRPNLLRFSNYMQECIDVLESSRDALASDKLLVEWCKMAKIAEDIATAFAFDDPSANISIQDIRVQLNLKGLARQLEQWRNSAGKTMTKCLELSYNVVLVYAHEIALHVNHNVDDFRPPYIQTIVDEPAIKPTAVLTTAHVDALSRCLTHARATLDNFLSMTIHEVRSSPIFTFVRTIYAGVMLMKLYHSASIPNSELGKVIDENALKISDYLTKLLEHLTKAAEGDKCPAAMKFRVVPAMLRSWWINQRTEIGELDSKASTVQVAQTQLMEEFNPNTTRFSAASTLGPSGRIGNDGAAVNSSSPHTPVDTPGGRSYNSPDQQKKTYTHPDTPLSFESPTSGLTTDRSCRTDDIEYEQGRIQAQNHPPSTPLHILSDVASEVQGSTRNSYGSSQGFKYDISSTKSISGTTYDSIANDGRFPSSSLSSGARMMPNIYTASTASTAVESLYASAAGVGATRNPAGSFAYAGTNVNADVAGSVKSNEADPPVTAFVGLHEEGASMFAGFTGSAQDLVLGPEWLVDDTFWAVMDGVPALDAWNGMPW